MNETKDFLQRADEVLKKATEVIANKEQILASHKEEISKMTDEEKKDYYIKILEIDNKGLKEGIVRRDQTINTLIQQIESMELSDKSKYIDGHPLIIWSKKDIEDLQKQFDKFS